MVLAKVGAASVPAMAAISLRLAAKPRSNAGMKCSISMRSNGGISKGVVHASSSGLVVAGLAFAAVALRLLVGATCDFRPVAGGFLCTITLPSRMPKRIC